MINSLFQRIAPPDLQVLPVDAALLDGRIQDVASDKLLLARLEAEAIDQSSETYHDNAPLDAVLEGKFFNRLTAGELQFYRDHSKVVYAPTVATKVAVATSVLLAQAAEDRRHTYHIAGDWLGRPNEIDAENTLLLRTSQLAGLLIDHSAQDVIAIPAKMTDPKSHPDDDTEFNWRVMAVEPLAEALGPVRVSQENLDPEQLRVWKQRRLLFISGPTGRGAVKLLGDMTALSGFNVINYDDSESLQAVPVEKRDAVVMDEIERLTATHPENQEGTAVVGETSQTVVNALVRIKNPTDTKVVYVVTPKAALQEAHKATVKPKDRLKKDDFEKLVDDEVNRTDLFRLARAADAKILRDTTGKQLNSRLKTFVINWTPSS